MHYQYPNPFFYGLWTAIVVASLLPVVFRASYPLRVACVAFLLAAALLSRLSFATAARDAITPRWSAGRWSQDFQDGVLDAERSFYRVVPEVTLIILGLIVLVLVPPKRPKT